MKIARIEVNGDVIYARYHEEKYYPDEERVRSGIRSHRTGDQLPDEHSQQGENHYAHDDDIPPGVDSLFV